MHYFNCLGVFMNPLGQPVLTVLKDSQREQYRELSSTCTLHVAQSGHAEFEFAWLCGLPILSLAAAEFVVCLAA